MLRDSNLVVQGARSPGGWDSRLLWNEWRIVVYTCTIVLMPDVMIMQTYSALLQNFTCMFCAPTIRYLRLCAVKHIKQRSTHLWT